MHLATSVDLPYYVSDYVIELLPRKKRNYCIRIENHFFEFSRSATSISKAFVPMHAQKINVEKSNPDQVLFVC